MNSTERNFVDDIIFKNLINNPEFIKAELILVYVSVGSEINTENIIDYCFENSKKVAVPYCDSKKMQFYFIDSFVDLTCIQFGIPTVDVNCAEPVTDYSNSLCVVPALAADESGCRLGYGGGYYDRFLSENNIPAICLCRNRFLCSELPHDSYDVKIKRIITENKTVEI